MKKLSFTDIYKMKKLAASLNARDFYAQYVKYKGISYEDFRKKFLKQNPNISELQFESVKFNPSSRMAKQSAAMLTPLAQAAAMPPPSSAPMDPSMMGGMPPAGDPAAMGGAPMGGAPIDPSMMSGDPAAMGGMPPGGAPMGGAPMDPSMGGAVPPGAWMQDPMFLLFLASIGMQQGPDGNFIGPDGQPVPPLMMDQIYMEFLMQMQSMGGMPGGATMGGAPMDPSMMGGDPAAMGGMPPGGEMPPELMAPAELPPLIMLQVSGMVQDIISSEFLQRFSTLDKKITAFNLKLDTIKTLLDDILVGSSKLQASKSLEDSLNALLERDLKSSQPTEAQPIESTEQMLAAQPVGNMLDIMRG